MRLLSNFELPVQGVWFVLVRRDGGSAFMEHWDTVLFFFGRFDVTEESLYASRVIFRRSFAEVANNVVNVPVMSLPDGFGCRIP